MIEHFFNKIQGWFDYANLYAEILDLYGHDDAIFVEIGSWKGRSAAFMATEIANKYPRVEFYCVDTWTGHGGLEGVVPAPVPDTDMHKLYETFLENIKPVKDHIIPIRQPSNIAADRFGDRTLDFIFIDAGHTYEDVKKDIMCWLPKLKTTGTLAGHDYLDKNYPGVKKAVDQLVPDSVEYLPFSWILRPEFIKKYQEKHFPHLR